MKYSLYSLLCFVLAGLACYTQPQPLFGPGRTVADSSVAADSARPVVIQNGYYSPSPYYNYYDPYLPSYYGQYPGWSSYYSEPWWSGGHHSLWRTGNALPPAPAAAAPSVTRDSHERRMLNIDSSGHPKKTDSVSSEKSNTAPADTATAPAPAEEERSSHERRQMH
jgi:hypothetical protein